MTSNAVLDHLEGNWWYQESGTGIIFPQKRSDLLEKRPIVFFLFSPCYRDKIASKTQVNVWPSAKIITALSEVRVMAVLDSPVNCF